MNRFKTYLGSQKLAKAFLVSAEQKLHKGDEFSAITLLIHSVREFQTATNCIASLYFERRKKRSFGKKMKVVSKAKPADLQVNVGGVESLKLED